MGNASKERVDLIKKVYSKTEYPKIIDTKFSQLGVTSVPNLNVADSVEQITDFNSIQKAFNDQERANPELTTTNPQSVSANTNPGY